MLKTEDRHVDVVSGKKQRDRTPAPSSSEISAGEALTMAEFSAPDCEARVMPFWFWNNHMSETTIRRQIAAMAEAGLGGFFLHPRQGLGVPYLSEAWFDRVKLAVRAAKEHGLKVWLYDEYPYPSGIAGGKLTAEHPEFRARVLDFTTHDVDGGESMRREFALGRVVSSLACPIEGEVIQWDRAIDLRRHFGILLTEELFWRWELEGCPYNDKRFMASEGRQILQWTPPPGRWRIFTGLETDQRGFKYYDWYFDPLCKGAAETFLRLTHERYADSVGGEFGRTITGIFTDETEPPAWSPTLEAELRERFKIDLGELMPALWDDRHPRAAEVRYRFRQASLSLFQERWEAPISNWCQLHGLVWGAEKPTSRPSQFLAVGQPGTDAGHRRAGDAPEPLTSQLRANSRAAMAAAEISGHGRVRCECFHNIGWGATLQDQKWQVDFLAAQGVNRFTPHAFYASTSGLRKHDAAPSFFLETPVWEHYRLLADYTARLSLALGKGREAARIAILHPTESLWVGGKRAVKVRESYEWLMNALMADHRFFHPVDSLSLKLSTAEPGALIVNQMRYEILLIPSLSAADKDTELAVRVALAAGVQVLMETPAAEMDVDGTRVDDLFRRPGVQQIATQDQWLPAIARHQARMISIVNEDGSEVPDVWAAWRNTDTQHIVFLANTSEADQELSLTLPPADWESWSLESASTTTLPPQQDGNVRLPLSGFGSALLIGTRKTNQARLNGASFQQKAPFCLPTEGTWNFSLDRPNALRLNRWTVGDGVEVEAVPLRHYDKANEEWRDALPRRVEGGVLYRRTVQCRHIPHDLSLLVEECAIQGEWRIEINGVELRREDFSAFEFLGSDKVARRVNREFRLGENTLFLRVDDTRGGLQTPIHLIGSFALTGKGRRTVDRLPTLAEFGGLIKAGLPHFSGTVIYDRVISLPHLAEGELVKFAADFQDVAEIFLDGRSIGVRAWSPYAWTLPFEVEGDTLVQIRVKNTLLPFFEGQRWDGKTRIFEDV